MYYHEIFELSDISYIDNNGIECVEKWLPVKSYNGYYEVSDLGRVRGLLRKVSNGKIIEPIILKQRFNISGYLVVTLRKNGSIKIPYVHKLVVESFLGNPYNKPEGNHKFGIKWDNRVSELEWATKSENIKHSFEILGKKAQKPFLGKFGKDNPKSKPVFCKTNGTTYESVSHAAKELNMYGSSISCVCRKEQSSTFGLVFEYV